MTTLARLAALGFAATLAACGGGGGNGSLAIDEIDEAYANAFCSKLFECCSAEEAMAFGQLLGFTDEASCKTSFQMDFEDELVEVKARVAAGELTYDGEAAADCVALSNGAACTEFLLPVGQTVCDRVIVGKLDNGQACTDDESCSSAYCETDPQGGGTCKAVPGQGEPCQSFCTAGLTCAGGTCQTPKADGAACEMSDECASGNCEGTCQPETTCDGNDTN